MYLRDKETGKCYKISSIRTFLISVIPALSLFVYGLLVSLLFTLFGLGVDTILLILLVAYAVEAILLLCNKPSLSSIVSGIMLFIVIPNIIIDISKYDAQKNKSPAEQINDIIDLSRNMSSITRQVSKSKTTQP